MLLLAALLAPTAHAEDLTVVVDRDVTHVVLQCGRERYEREVSEGKTRPDGSHALTFPIHPGQSCDLTVTQPIGSLEQIGEWRCGTSGCTQTAGAGPTETVADGTIKLIIGEDPSHIAMELNCPSGYRQRAAIEDNAATFADVPDEECTVLFKGGAPLKYRPVRWGVYRCHVVSGTAVCKQ